MKGTAEDGASDNPESRPTRTPLDSSGGMEAIAEKSIIAHTYLKKEDHG
jgi:hypothetical protein